MTTKRALGVQAIDAAVARGEVPTPKMICAAMGEDGHNVNSYLSSYRIGRMREAGFTLTVRDGKGIFGSPRWVPPGKPVPPGWVKWPPDAR